MGLGSIIAWTDILEELQLLSSILSLNRLNGIIWLNLIYKTLELARVVTLCSTTWDISSVIKLVIRYLDIWPSYACGNITTCSKLGCLLQAPGVCITCSLMTELKIQWRSFAMEKKANRNLTDFGCTFPSFRLVRYSRTWCSTPADSSGGGLARVFTRAWCSAGINCFSRGITVAPDTWEASWEEEAHLGATGRHRKTTC